MISMGKKAAPEADVTANLPFTVVVEVAKQALFNRSF
jgi:hypothetical protein